MKRKAMTLALSTLTALLLTGAALAASNPTQQEQVVKLAVAKDRLVAGAQSVKPGQAVRMRDQADDLQKMIDSAQSGKKLSPAQVDDAIRRSFQNY